MSSNKKFEVGQKWKLRNEAVYEITKLTNDFVEARYYDHTAACGHMIINCISGHHLISRNPHRYDLMELIQESPAAEDKLRQEALTLLGEIIKLEGVDGLRGRVLQANSDTGVGTSSRCECGSEIARVTGHSIWCPKYQEST